MSYLIGIAEVPHNMGALLVMAVAIALYDRFINHADEPQRVKLGR